MGSTKGDGGFIVLLLDRLDQAGRLSATLTPAEAEVEALRLLRTYD